MTPISLRSLALSPQEQGSSVKSLTIFWASRGGTTTDDRDTWKRTTNRACNKGSSSAARTTASQVNLIRLNRRKQRTTRKTRDLVEDTRRIFERASCLRSETFLLYNKMRTNPHFWAVIAQRRLVPVVSVNLNQFPLTWASFLARSVIFAVFALLGVLVVGLDRAERKRFVWEPASRLTRRLSSTKE